MVVEIGTCDFETLAGKVAGLFVEPVKYYFDRLPHNCCKENVAVSDYEGETNIYYVDPAQVETRKLNSWIRGCNSIGKPHIQHASIAPEILRADTVRVVRIKTLLDKHAINEIDLLKIDTEGHDAIILRDFLNTCDILPREIFFENNGLVPANDIYDIAARLEQRGYSVKLLEGAGIATRRPHTK